MFLELFTSLMLASQILELPISSNIRQIKTGTAKSVGSYSQALSVDVAKTKSFVFVSGQVPVDPRTGIMVKENIEVATRQALDNVEEILHASGTDWSHVVRVDVFLSDFNRDWAGMDAVYTERFPNGIFPARQTVGVDIGSDTLVEISCIAAVPKS